MVSFKNESIQERIENRRKMQSSSIEVIIAFLILILIAGTFGVMKFWQKTLNDEIEISNKEIERQNNSMKNSMTGEKADFYKRMELMKKNIYDKHSSVTILQEIEKSIVPRVVLLSFAHSIENSGSELVTISADADEYFLMAQQIEELKKNPFFRNVRASDTSRDNVGRIVFTIKMEVASKDSLYYPAEKPAEVESDNEEVNVTN